MIKKISALTVAFLMLLGTLSINAYVTTDEAKLPFSDAQSGWYLSAVEFCYVNEIMSGKSQTSFDPKGETTREQMMTVLSMLDGDEETYPQCSFTDVNQKMWYAPYVNKAVAKGYTNGISETLFGIRKSLTRQETVTLMYNLAVSSGYVTSTDENLSAFSDTANIADWALNAFKWAVSKQVVSGSNGKLNPTAAITRAELAQLIKTFCENVLYSDCNHTYTAATCTLSSRCTLCGLKKGMPTGHRHLAVTCTSGSTCTNCGILFPATGHNFTAATCGSAMKCSTCGVTNGTVLGHTVPRGVCARCGKELFKDTYDKFTYYMTQRAMTDGNVKYLMANVKHTDGYTSTQYVKYDPATGKTTLEIIYKFANNDHSIKTVVYILGVASTYTVETYYSVGSKTPYYGSAKITAADNSFALSSYTGNSSYRTQFETVSKNTALLCLDAANTLMKDNTGLSLSDFGFNSFK